MINNLNNDFKKIYKYLIILSCFIFPFLSSAFTNVIDMGLIPNDPSFDNTPIFNQLVANIDNTGNGHTLYFPTGTYYFNSKPDIINNTLVIIGDHVNSTTFIRNYSANNYYEALLHTTKTITIEKIAILAAPGTNHGGAIRLEGLNASASILRDLYITCQGVQPGQIAGTFDIPLTLCSTHELGIRGCLIDNVELFAATIHIAWLVNVQGLTARINGYPAGGSVNHITIQGTGNYYSANIQMDTRHLVTLYVYQTNNLTLRDFGTTNIIIDNKSTNIRKL